VFATFRLRELMSIMHRYSHCRDQPGRTSEPEERMTYTLQRFSSCTPTDGKHGQVKKWTKGKLCSTHFAFPTIKDKCRISRLCEIWRRIRYSIRFTCSTDIPPDEYRRLIVYKRGTEVLAATGQGQNTLGRWHVQKNFRQQFHGDASQVT
jgi:hypothetical protein